MGRKADSSATHAKVSVASSAQASAVFDRLVELYPSADCELVPRDPFQLLVAVVLSAQTTDVAVNRLLPALFASYPTADALAKADPELDVQPLLRSIGMFRQKAKNIVGLARMLVEHHRGDVPRSRDELVRLPGVGNKTANVVMGVAFGVSSGVVVDTHVSRLAQRLGWSAHTKPEPIARDLERLFPQDRWIMLSHLLIFHGRRVCSARKPACDSCAIMDACPSVGNAEQTGRKKTSKRSSHRKK